MKQPSREIILNAREAARHDPDNIAYNPCSGFDCPECAFHFLELPCSQNTVDQDIQFFKDFLAKYDTEDTMLKVGDKVRVRTDLVIGKEYGDQSFVNGMDRFKGNTYKISKTKCTWYNLDGDEIGWSFTKEMLERIDTMDTEQEIEALKVRIAKLEGKKDTYPCIKRYKDGMAVLFTKENTGVVLSKCTNDYGIGHQSNCWTESNFTETLTEYTIKV